MVRTLVQRHVDVQRREATGRATNLRLPRPVAYQQEMCGTDCRYKNAANQKSTRRRSLRFWRSPTKITRVTLIELATNSLSSGAKSISAGMAL